MTEFRLAIASVLMVLMLPNVGAYEIETHADLLTNRAVNKSVLQGDPDVLRNLGLDKSLTDPTQRFLNTEGEPRTILQLIEDGARFEDSLFPTVRVTRHFYNPLTGLGLDVSWLPTQTASPDWALAPRGSDSNQKNSYADARQYFFEALTKPAKKDRETAFGRTFQTLGQVVHHIQDMAQPQHVRNDSHHPGSGRTLYETWTNDVRGTLAPHTNPAMVGYDITGALFTSTFNSPRKFWHTDDGKGMADYTNRGFVSAGTNFDEPGLFPSPTWDPQSVISLDIKHLLPGTNLAGKLFFYGNAVEDKFLGPSINNPMASTNSIFSADLKKYAPKKQAIFTLNRFNFDVAHSLLIPRAVGYSAGLINYFFRGKMDWEEDLANLGRFVVKNGSDERMAGELSLHYDLDDGQRNRVTGFATSVNVDPQVETAVTIPVGFIKESPERFDNETYMLVFKGTLGEEKPQGDSPGAVLGKQVRIRNVFDIYDTLYRPWSNYPKGFIWFYFDWEEQGSAEIREALQSALRASRVAINGHKLTPLEYSNGDRVGYVATSDFYAQISLSSVPSTRYSQTNYLYIQNVDPSGIVEVTVDERIIARFDWQSVNDSFFRYSKPFRVR